MYDFLMIVAFITLIATVVFFALWLVAKFRHRPTPRRPWGRYTIIALAVFIIATIGYNSTAKGKQSVREDSISESKADVKSASESRSKAKQASKRKQESISKANSISKSKQSESADKKASSESKAKASSKVNASLKAVRESKTKAKASSKSESQKVKKSESKKDSTAYQKSLNAYCRNSGKALSAKYDDGQVTYKVSDSYYSTSDYEKDDLTSTLIDHANKLANLCDVDQPFSVLVYTKSGDIVGREKLNGDVKTY